MNVYKDILLRLQSTNTRNEHMLSYRIQDERENHLKDDPTNKNSESLENDLFKSSKESVDIRMDNHISEFSDESLSSVSILNDSDLKILEESFNPKGTNGFGTHTKHQWGEGPKRALPSISRMTNATNLKPSEVLEVSFKDSKNFKLIWQLLLGNHGNRSIT